MPSTTDPVHASNPSPTQPTAPAPSLVALLAFDRSNRLAVRKLGNKAGLAFTGTDLAGERHRTCLEYPLP